MDSEVLKQEVGDLGPVVRGHVALRLPVVRTRSEVRAVMASVGRGSSPSPPVASAETLGGVVPRGIASMKPPFSARSRGPFATPA